MYKKIILISFVFNAGLLMSQVQQVNASVPKKVATAVAPRTFYNLCIFVAFKGYTAFNTRTSTHYTTLSNFVRNQTDPTSGSYSVKSLFTDITKGMIDYQFKTFPRQTTADTIVYYQDTYKPSYYQPYSATNLDGYTSSADLLTRKRLFRDRALTDIGSRIPTGEVLDGDGDGKIDCVTFLFLDGTGGDFGNLGGGGYSNTFSGYTLNMAAYIVGDNWMNVGPYAMFTHEVGHCTGIGRTIPDNYEMAPIYRNWKGPGSKGTPATHPFYLYNTYLKWSSPEINLISKAGTYALKSVYSSTNDSCFIRINSPFSKTEFFYLEYHGKHFYEKEEEGLQIRRITPGVCGNYGADINKPIEQYVLRPTGDILSANIMGKDLTEFTDPALVLSDRTPAGFRLKNIRREGELLKFELEYSDTKPFIDVLDTVDVINSGVTTIEWPVTVNPSNALAWRIQAQNAAWLHYAVDYDKQVIRMTSDANLTALQRNAIFKVYVGTTLVDWGYLTQRPLNNGQVSWLPEVSGGILRIDGNEGMHALRIIGDLQKIKPITIPTNATMFADQDIIKYLPTRELAFRALRNSTAADVSVTATYTTSSGTVKSFQLIQSPAVNPQPTYLPKPFPVIDDGKWYILESKKTGKVFGNYLQPVKSGVDVVLGVDVFIPSDSIYWTLESNASGKVLIRNKALGYIDFDVLANNVLKFKQTKPIAGMTMTPFGTVDQSISFFGDTTGILKGLCPTDLANSFKIGYNSFSLTNDITRFDFNEKSFHSLFSLQKSYAGMVNVGNGIGCTSQIEKDKFSTAMSLIYNNYMQIANPTQAQTDVAIRSICDARVTFMNSIKQPQTSTAAIPVWYRIKTNWMYWQIYKQFYLYTTGTGLLNTANVTTADNFMFRFENIGNGKVRIIPKNYPTQALRAGVLYASYTFSIAPFDQYTEFNLIDYPGANGVMKLIVGNTINATYPSYMHYPTTFPDITTAQVLNNYLVADLRMYLTNDWTMNSFEIEEVVPTFTATESVIAEHSIIRVVDGRVLVDGTDKIDIYNIYGVKMPLKQRLATGVYIVVVANQAQKIIVR